MKLSDIMRDFWVNIAAGIAIIVAGFVINRFRRKAIIKLARLLLPELSESGLVMTYKSMSDAAKSIEAAIQHTKKLRILSNKGTDWLGYDNAVLTRVITERKQKLTLDILLLSRVAPWLQHWAQLKNLPLQVIKDEFGASHKVIETFFKKHNKKFTPDSFILYHRDNPVWRFLITDDRAFISSYANDDQARNAIVFEFRGPDNEVYRAFDRYFDFLSQRRGVNKDEVAESLTREVGYDSYEISTGAVVYVRSHGQVKILLLQRRRRNKRKADFTLPKGHVRDDESFESAVKREIEEETGLSIRNLKIEKRLKNYPNPIVVKEQTRILKTICYFLIRYDLSDQSEPRATTDAHTTQHDNLPLPILKVERRNHESAEWCPIEDIGSKHFAYSHVEEVLKEASRHLVISQN